MKEFVQQSTVSLIKKKFFFFTKIFFSGCCFYCSFWIFEQPNDKEGKETIWKSRFAHLPFPLNRKRKRIDGREIKSEKNVSARTFCAWSYRKLSISFELIKWVGDSKLIRFWFLCSVQRKSWKIDWIIIGWTSISLRLMWIFDVFVGHANEIIIRIIISPPAITTIMDGTVESMALNEYAAFFSFTLISLYD